MERKSQLPAFMELKDRKVIVLGLAKSGVAAAQLLLSEGAVVVVNDAKHASDLRADIEALGKSPSLTVVTGSHPPDIVDEKTALIVKNPGISMDLPLLLRARELGVTVITEVELAFWQLAAPIVAITGTNGKTTTTALAGEMFAISGRRTFVAGNIGLPLSSVVKKASAADVVVAELSSFQLEGTIYFRPAISAVLNITPDHMDRHRSLEKYKQVKARIFANQTTAEAVVINADDPEAFDLHDHTAARVYLFSRKREVGQGAFVRAGHIVLRSRESEVSVCAVTEIAIPGAHNLENALAASLLAWLGGVKPVDIAQVLKTFKGVPHRLEYVETIAGIKFINDSKGTNTDAAIKALESYHHPKVLIAGGYDKGSSFDSLAMEIKKHVSHVVLIGQVRERLAAALRMVGFNEYQIANGLEDAVGRAYRAAAPGWVVLLSPACASWDMFNNFEERGELFKKAVLKLREENNGRKH
ncbi:MAG: UDP-N-acetylmuramoyl-L-alanine--D-glutamate ligase [Dethiobacter sp.]|jgi:UDP-N-acetylmuramoylalanine--D-glutamate ligase|nr:UDP-N-acetylmuramoyl-L-alanine--D-glutamate ligase [Dethiobacter sp.]